MNILKFVSEELSYLPNKPNLTVNYVAKLTYEGDQNFFRKFESGKKYWLPWTDELAAWVSKDGSHVEIVVKESAKEQKMLGTLTLGLTSVIAATLTNIKNLVAIHANAIAINGAVIAFAGCSGAGKSTLSTYCLMQGSIFVTDDVLIVDSKGLVMPGNPRIKLFAHTASKLGLDSSQKTEYKNFYCPQDLGGKIHKDSFPLSVIYIPSISSSDEIYSETLLPTNGFVELLTQSYHASKIIGDSKLLFFAYTSMLNRTTVKRLYYPRKFELLPKVFKFVSEEADNYLSEKKQIDNSLTM